MFDKYGGIPDEAIDEIEWERKLAENGRLREGDPDKFDEPDEETENKEDGE